ncbi:MAG: asparagine synthase (glutamine-hydrolyzing) [Burkholderiales bacterium]
MCGIAGLFSLEGPRPSDPGIVDAMCRQIIHRGPDDQGVFVHPLGQIGMRRLSIIDLGGGHQPIHNEDKSIWIVFNGEIYNYRELREELQQLGHSFYTQSDTECIVHAYEQYGEDCFARLRGMFGVAILDLRHGKLVLGRDRIGKKPLYYARTKAGWLAFASELKSLFPVPGFEAQVAPTAVRDYFSLGYVPAPDSIYQGVSKLPPAHYMVVQSGEVTIKSYWRPVFEPKWSASEAELEQRLLQELDDAVKVRLMSDVPFGAFLSGGTDSSVVAALMARNMNTPVKTFTIGFEEAAFNEMPDARAVARHIGAEHHELVVKADAVGMMSKLVWYFDEPFGDSSAIPTYLVSQLASRHVKMVLSGDGGDEVFAGYERYRKYDRLNKLVNRSGGLAVPALRLAGLALGGAKRVRLGRIADRLATPFPDRYLSGVGLCNAADLSMLLAPGVPSDDPYASVRHHFMRTDIELEAERILSGDMATYLSDDIMVKVDRMTMACSIEARAPLLDHRLIEFSARLPYSMKYRDGVGKYLFKQVARRLLPAEVMDKPKQGFAIPVAQWFRTDLREMMQDTLSDQRFRERGLFRPEAAQQLMNQHLAGTHDRSEMLWLLLTFEMWARRFLDQPMAQWASAQAAA